GGAVERMAGGELVLVEMRDRHGHVLLLATGVREAQVHELDFVFLHHLHHVCNGLGHQGSPGINTHRKMMRKEKQVACQPARRPWGCGAPPWPPSIPGGARCTDCVRDSKWGAFSEIAHHFGAHARTILVQNLM